MGRLVPVSQDFLYDRLRDALVSGKIGVTKEVEEVSKPSFIRTKIAFTGSLASVDIHITPQNGGSQIKYSYNFKKFLFTFLLIGVFAYIILLSFMLSESIHFEIFRILTALAMIFGFLFPVVSSLDSKRRFSEQFEHLLREIELVYKYEYEKMTIALEGLSEEARELYKKILDKHSKSYLNYKIGEYGKRGLSLEEAIRKVAREDKIT